MVRRAPVCLVMFTLAAGVILGGCRENVASPFGETPDTGTTRLDASRDAPAVSGVDASGPQPESGPEPSVTGCPPDGGVPNPPTEHIAQTVACAPAGGSYGYPDVDAMCSTDTDCVDAGAANAEELKCLQGKCVVDQCLVDSDCPAGHACGCADQFGVNACVAFSCRVDTDCGPGGFCSPSSASACEGGALGYFCHTPADTCANDSDCSCISEGGCTYQPAVGHWRCVSYDAWCVE